MKSVHFINPGTRYKLLTVLSKISGWDVQSQKCWRKKSVHPSLCLMAYSSCFAKLC